MRRSLIACGVAIAPALVQAGGVPTATHALEEVVVTGKLEQLNGAPISATVGVVTSEQLDLRPVLRTGELLEVVPGLIVTQHSGDGKANQYFLRGFNLDHGTDLATSVDGVPVNMPTHAHGQGYTDINFIIPELVNAIRQFLRRRRGQSAIPKRCRCSDRATRGGRGPLSACVDRHVAASWRRHAVIWRRAFADRRAVVAGRGFSQDQRVAALLARE
jgi:hypothetical protein